MGPAAPRKKRRPVTLFGRKSLVTASTIRMRILVVLKWSEKGQVIVRGLTAKGEEAFCNQRSYQLSEDVLRKKNYELTKFSLLICDYIYIYVL